MHLKSIEMIGFKSFADRTKLEFEPGMVAIVGPNGCGKSNVSDAIRWVLGEQRPTALRGSRMQDVIFGGTDARKPLGMAEVSITFTECGGALPVEFEEVTITRRVFRSGESAYFLNRNPCRLRDVHRLFMGTGIGTTSYSVMAQGQIDAILSSKPEDRRGVFEEAAGITKFKSDRKEALRKLEQTDANVLRLADVIREVRRQIGSLQRQAGKAQKYRELREEMCRLDLYATRKRLAALDTQLREMEAEAAGRSREAAAGIEAVAAAERETGAAHAAVLEAEHEIGALTEAAAQADGRLQHAHELIRIGEQRMAEYRQWTDRDTVERDELSRQSAEARARQDELAARSRDLAAARDRVRADREAAQAAFDAGKAAVEAVRGELQKARDASVEQERLCARVQNRIAALESQQRDSLLLRERLGAEQGQLARADEDLGRSLRSLDGEIETLRARVADREGVLSRTEAERDEVAGGLARRQSESSQVQAQLAARRAQLDLLREQVASNEDFQAGSRLLLDAANPLAVAPGAVLGSLAAKFAAAPECRTALEAVLRAWIDAVVVRGPDEARAIVAALHGRGQSSATRLIGAAGTAAPPPAPPAPAGLAPLLAHVTVSDDFREAADRILGRVYLVESLEAVPGRLPQGCTVVTRSGTVFHADGCVEIWRPDAQNATPLARHLAIGDGREQAGALERRLAALQTEAAGLARDAERIAALLPGQRADLERLRRDAAQREGERQSVARDAERAHERLAVVTGELDLLRGQMSGADAEAAGLRAELERGLAAREALVEAVAAQSAALGAAEARLAAGNADLTEHRIREANQSQQLAHHQEQVRAAAARIEEIARQIEGRTAGVRSYAERIEALNAEAAETRSRLGELEDAVRSLQERTEAARRNRASRGRELDRAQGDLAERRQRLDGARERKARLDVDIAEARFRRQSHLDRVHAEYGVTPERLAAEPDPDWPAQPPAIEEVEARVAQLADSIREMGPVNLVAIEEYKELEERLTFLKAQEDDLLKSKDQVLDLIRMINKKSAEMFRTTFEEANRNFERMFTRLFNGGTARLEMVADEEGDPLEAGIEIIARPPGKRPQSISLLSGGERTMTAVSLLFAIYLIKPSPFCILDELDAALDDSNIGRFIQALTDFLVQSQFLIITHNQHTIASSDIVYGITMPERGVSRVVSMRLKDIGARELEIAPEQPAEPPAESPAKPRRPRARKAAKTPAGTEAPVPAGETQSPAADLTQTETPAP